MPEGHSCNTRLRCRIVSLDRGRLMLKPPSETVSSERSCRLRNRKRRMVCLSDRKAQKSVGQPALKQFDATNSPFLVH